MSLGEYADTVLYFGKYKTRTLNTVPNGYLVYMTERDWFEKEYPDLSEAFENELE